MFAAVAHTKILLAALTAVTGLGLATQSANADWHRGRGVVVVRPAPIVVETPTVYAYPTTAYTPTVVAAPCPPAPVYTPAPVVYAEPVYVAPAYVPSTVVISAGRFHRPFFSIRGRW